MDSELKDNYTMKHNEIITDELIAKYISGKTNEEEDRLIHDYLAQNPEFANDLLDIATAIRHQRKHDETTANKDKEQTQEAMRVRLVIRRSLYALAASFVLLIGIRFFVSKPFANNEMIQEQPTIAEANTETSSTLESIEEMALETPAIINTEPEEGLFVDNQGNQLRETNNIAYTEQEELFAENTSDELLSQQEINNVELNNIDGPIMASQTIYQDNSNEPCLEESVFVTDSIPTICNPKKAFVMKWNCNATSLTLEFSTEDGESKVWKKPSYDITGKSDFNITSTKLRDFMIYNNKCFYWRMTAKYRDGNLTRQGMVKFSEDNK